MKTELFPIVNDHGEVIGNATRFECHNKSFILHPVVHLHIFNSRGELYLQKRSLSKDIQPGMWDTSVGGHVDFGEDIATALKREASEELSIHNFEARFIASYIFESDVEKEYVSSFYAIWDNEILPDNNEISEGKFWKIEQIKEMIGKNIFTKNFEKEFINTVQFIDITCKQTT